MVERSIFSNRHLECIKKKITQNNGDTNIQGENNTTSYGLLKWTVKN